MTVNIYNWELTGNNDFNKRNSINLMFLVCRAFLWSRSL